MNRLARTASVGWLTLLSSVACVVSPTPAPVPVEGASADLAALAGEWSGLYWSDSVARHGTLVFRLRPGSDTAYGEVEMRFTPALRLYGEPAETPLRQAPCTTLDLAVVRMAGDTVRGTLAPYWDPDCGCRTHTVFVGEVIADSIAGTFSSRRESADLPLLTGHWFAVRE